jgi:hypothetical protein
MSSLSSVVHTTVLFGGRDEGSKPGFGLHSLLLPNLVVLSTTATTIFFSFSTRKTTNNNNDLTPFFFSPLNFDVSTQLKCRREHCKNSRYQRTSNQNQQPPFDCTTSPIHILLLLRYYR